MKHIYFSGIGGAGLGPLAEIAQDAGWRVSGSDILESPFTTQLERRGIDIVFEQTATSIAAEHLANPIDWLVYSSSLAPDHPELVYAREHNIKTTKRADFLNHIIKQHNQRLIAIAGTHGKTTTTGLLIWAFSQLGIQASYSIGSTLSFAPSGKFDKDSKFFIYEADEYDRNFLDFYPAISVLPAVDYDHPDTYKTRENYKSAFRQFITQSEINLMFQHTADYLAPLEGDYSAYHHTTSFSEIALAGQARRDDAFLAKQVLLQIDDYDESELDKILSDFPGSGRRFEQLAPNLISDYAHHPTEIAATVQMALEINPNVVVVYEPHQNQRQLQTISQYQTIFQGVKQLYWLPTYMPSGGREKNSKILRPEDFIQTLSGVKAEAAQIDRALWDSIEAHIAAGDLVVAMSAGGLDAWLRTKLAQETD